MGVEDPDYPPNCQPVSSSSSNSELIKRLKAISEALHEADSNHDVNEPNRYHRLFMHLSDEAFLTHQNKDVQVYLACCLVNIIRVFSPELPVSDPRNLKEQFLLIIRVVKSIGEVKVDNPMFKRYHYLLELLNATKLMNIAGDMGDEATGIYRNLMKAIFFVPNGSAWKKIESKRIRREVSEHSENDSQNDGEEKETHEKVKDWLIELASRTIREMDHVTNSVLDVLFFYLIKPQKLHCPESNEMAYYIVKKCKSHLEPSIHAVLEQSMLNGELPSDFELTGSASRPVLYEVIRELHDISRELVTTTFQFFPALLHSEETDIRNKTTLLIGVMARSSQSKFGVSADDATWNAYLQRFRDVNPAIREQCAKNAQEMLLKHPQVRGQILGCLERLVVDVEESVRLATLQVVRDVARQRLEVISESLIIACTDRMKDKKAKVRSEAVKCMLFLFHTVANDTSDKYTQSDRESVFIIPQKALAAYKILANKPGMEETRIIIERYFQLYIVSYKVDANQRVKLMAELYKKLDATETHSFQEIVKRSSNLRRILREVLDIISRSSLDKEEKSKGLGERVRKLCTFFPDPNQMSNALKIFVNLISSDQKCFELLEYIVANQYTSDRMANCAGDLVKKIQETKSVTSLQSGPGQLLRQFVDRCTPLSMDTEAAMELVLLVTSTVKDAQCLNSEAVSARPKHLKLLKVWTENFAHLFSDDETINNLIELLKVDDVLAVETALESLKNCIQQSSVKQRMMEAAWFEPLCKKTEEFVQSDQLGYNRVSKMAMLLLCQLLGREKIYTVIDDVIDTLVERIDLENPACANSLSVLELIYRTDPVKYVSKIMKITNNKKLMGREIFLSTKTDPSDPVKFDPILPMDQQPWPKYALAKVAAMKFVTRTLLSTAGLLEKKPMDKLKKEASESAAKWLEAFSNIIRAAGDISGKETLCAVERARLRATAGSCILKLCYWVSYRKSFDTESFIFLSKLMQDEAACVRNHFVIHLRKGLSRRLPIEFGGIFACVNYVTKATSESDGADVQSYIDGCLRLASSSFAFRASTTQKSREIEEKYQPSYFAEHAISYAIYLLAHNEALTSHEDVVTLTEIQECLWTVISAQIAAKCNTELIYQSIDKVKCMGDQWMKDKLTAKKINKQQLDAHNKKLWAVAHLAVNLLGYRAKVIVAGECSDKIKLNKLFFYREPEADPAEVFAPDELLEAEMKRNGKVPKVTNSKRKNTSSSTMSEKSKSKRQPKSRSKKKVSIESASEKDEEEEEEEDLQIEDEEVIPKKKNRKMEKEDEEELGPSTSRRIEKENGIEKKSSPAKKKARIQVEETSHEDSEAEETTRKSPRKSTSKVNGDSSLEDLILSPIEKEGRRTTRSRGGAATLSSSTPFRKSTGAESKRKSATNGTTSSPLKKSPRKSLKKTDEKKTKGGKRKK